MQKVSAFFASRVGNHEQQVSVHCRPCQRLYGFSSVSVAECLPHLVLWVHAELKVQDEVVSERRVARVMKENGISPQPRGPMVPVTTLSNHKKSLSPNLLQRKFDRYTCCGILPVSGANSTYTTSPDSPCHLSTTQAKTSGRPSPPEAF